MKKATNNKIISIKCDKTHFTQISHQITKNKKLSDFAIRLYGYLKSHNDNFYLSYSTIAHYLEISETKLKKGIKELKQSGFLEIEKKGNENIYILYDSPKNEEYQINYLIENDRLNYSDIMTIAKILNNKRITKETRQKLIDKIQKIIHTDWLNTND